MVIEASEKKKTKKRNGKTKLAATLNSPAISSWSRSCRSSNNGLLWTVRFHRAQSDDLSWMGRQVGVGQNWKRSIWPEKRMRLVSVHLADLDIK